MRAQEGGRIVDDTGVDRVLGAMIADGTQGSVYRVQGHPDLAIKLLSRPDNVAQVRRVRRLPLDGLGLAVPTALVTVGGSGYLMPLAGDMQPVRWRYLPLEFTEENTIAWFRETGGLRRRLGILAQVASTLAALHGRGLVYVDLHPDNIMVSDVVERFDTWLIDTDNLTSRAEPQWTIRGAHRYLAPERAMPDIAPSTYADVYAFAVHVFRMLTTRHPLEGRQIEGMPREEAWTRMDTGDVPYVEDPADRSNALPERGFATGLLGLVLTPEMRELLEQSFVVGKVEPFRRPTAAQWRDVLLEAFDRIIECSGCGWTHYASALRCPDCQAWVPVSTMLTVSNAEDPQAPRRGLVLDQHHPTRVLPRHVWGRHAETEPVLVFTPVGGGYRLRPAEGVSVRSADGAAVVELPAPTGNEVTVFRFDVADRGARYLSVQAVATG
jgi:DNA-binding helix-hairpin-helix protein with protein kinase domain